MKVKSKRILIVGPDSQAARELSSVFIGEGYDVEVSLCVKDTAERINDVKFDCIIMDVDLPEMEGFKAVSILKAIDPKIEIIMTASENTAQLEANVRRQDIFYYYIKSFDREELRQAVRDVFEKLGKVKKVKKMDKPAKILVVDDDPLFAKAIEAILSPRGYEVHSVGNKAEALEQIYETKPDLIVLDIMMEKLTDGFDICYKLKHDPEMKRIPVLAVSAITKETGFKFSPVTDGEYFEADDYMEKPVKTEDMLKRVKKLLQE